MVSLPDPPLLLITDRRQALLDLDQVATAAFEAGCRWLLLREKDLEASELEALARRLIERAEAFGALVSLSGDPETAKQLSVAGLHLPRGGDITRARKVLGEDALIGISAHGEGEAAKAARAGADYLTLSPIFESPSKPGYGPALGLGTLGTIAAVAKIPVIALGGITAARAGQSIGAGAAGVAVMGGIMAAADPGQATAQLIEALARAG